MASDDLVLPERVVLLHIGPHKTGTTTVQSAFHHSRSALIEQGVRYAGPEQNPFWAARTVVGSEGVPGRRKPRPRAWKRLVREVAESPEGRVVVSSEAFAGADEAAVARVVRRLGSSRPVHVVVTLRPLSKIVPSQWQQFVQNGFRRDYDSWLTQVFNDDDDRSRRPTFWRRHDHAALVSRWADAVGAANLTVIAVDESDRGMLVRTFERLIGVRAGTLVAPAPVANRSLTMAEIELVRRVNIEIRGDPWAQEAYSQVMKDGVSDAMQINRQPGPGEAAITTPRWALERAARIGAESAARISALGVRIIGNIETIGAMPADSAVQPAGVELPTTVPLDAAVLAVVGAIRGLDRARPPAPPDDAGEPAAAEGELEAAMTDPAATDPAATDPAATDPAATDPAATDPAATDPAATDPAATDPAATESAPTDPTPLPVLDALHFLTSGRRKRVKRRRLPPGTP